jgi:hypothetical protein
LNHLLLDGLLLPLPASLKAQLKGNWSESVTSSSQKTPSRRKV